MAEGLFFLAIFIISSETNKWTVASEVDDANYCKLCPTLCFKGHHNDQLPCTECTDSEIKKRSFTDHCNHMKTLPWQREIKCDSQSPTYHLPKCQKISLEVKCQNEHLGERYHMACGDVCTIVCRDKVVSVVECTKDLEWNDTIPDEHQCPQEQEPNSSDVTTIIIGTSVCCIAAVVITCIVLFIKYKRQKSISRGSSTTSDPPERSVEDGDTLLLPGYNQEYVTCHPPKKVSEFPCWTPLLGGSEAPGVVSSSATELTEQIDSTKSRKILTDLLNDRSKAKILQELFDQQSCFSKITWHVIALHLLGWTAEKVDSQEYQYSSNGLRDSPTYKILLNLTHEGKGIDELIDFLKDHQSCLKTTNRHNAIEHLRNYRQDWYNKQKLVHSCEDKV